MRIAVAGGSGCVGRFVVDEVRTFHDFAAQVLRRARGPLVGRTPQAVRQLATRARAHVSARAPRVNVGSAEHNATVTTFLRAAAGGDLSALLTALDPDVVLTSDGGGQVSAARRPVHGAERVARLVLGMAAKIRPSERVHVINVNGAPGLGLFDSGGLTAVVSLTVSGDRITRVDLIRAPGKLPPPALASGGHRQGIDGDDGVKAGGR